MNIKNIIATAGWSVEPGVHDGVKFVTWLVCSASGKMVAECESKTVAAHVVKIHNAAVRSA